MKAIWSWGRQVIKSFLDNNCSMHAAGLTYFSILAIVPILCVLLVAAQVCGLDDYAKQGVNDYLDKVITQVEHGQDDQLLTSLPIPTSEEDREKKRVAAEFFAQQAREVSNTLFSRIEAFDIKTFGWIGFGLLLWTVISSISMVEVSFNEIWAIKKPRPVWKRAYTYLGVALALPIFAALAMSPQILTCAKAIVTKIAGTTAVTARLGDGVVWLIDSWVIHVSVTFAVASIGFAAFFWLMPNASVRFRSALWGGMIVAVLFGGWMKLCAVAQVGIAKSSAMYGSFALVPIVLAWIYMSWQIVLLGACMTHAFAKADLT